MTAIEAPIPASAICFFVDHATGLWKCVFGDFKNETESPVGIGATFDVAVAALQQNHRERKRVAAESN